MEERTLDVAQLRAEKGEAMARRRWGEMREDVGRGELQGQPVLERASETFPLERTTRAVAGEPRSPPLRQRK